MSGEGDYVLPVQEFRVTARPPTAEDLARTRYGRPWRWDRAGYRRAAGCVLAASLTLLAVGAAFYLAVPVVAPGIPPQFENAALFRPWAGWTSTYMLLHPLAFGAVFAGVYLLLWQWTFLSGWQGGLRYGLGVFVVGSLPVYLLVFAAFAVSPEMITSWILQSGCQYAAAGAAVGAVAGR